MRGPIGTTSNPIYRICFKRVKAIILPLAYCPSRLQVRSKGK